MSTKTTFKRVALVAVAALGLGVMSVAPSNAAVQLDSISVSTASTTQKTTETLTATAAVLTATVASTNSETMTVTATIQSGPAYVAPVLKFLESTTASTTGTGTAEIKISGRTASVSQAIAKYSLYLDAPSTVGTYVIKLTPTGASNAVATTVSIVVSAITIQAPNAANSEVWLSVSDTMVAENQYGSWVQGSVGARYSGLFANGEAGYAAGGLVAGNLSDAKTIGVLTAGTMIGSGAWRIKGADSTTAATRSPVTFTISGPAKFAFQTDASSPYSKQYQDTSVTESKLGTVGTDPYDPTNQDGSFFLYSTGSGGVVKVTATMGGVEIGTRSFSIIGAATNYVFGTPTKTIIGVGASETASVAITGTDSYGTTTGAALVYAFSSDTSVATVNNTQASTVVIEGKKSGTAIITVGNASTLATSTITKTLAIKVGAVTAKTVAFSMSPTAPQPGEKVTLTVTATDASGNPLGDGPRNLFSASGITTSLAVQGYTWTLNTAAVTLVGGKAEYTFYAPTGTGTLTVSATEGSDTDSTTKGSISGSVSITNSAVDAAQMAAEEATAAAQDATDAALGAAEAAEAAGALAQEAVDLVTELSANVTKLISDLKAQITTLTNLVIKIQKKVGAK